MATVPDTVRRSFMVADMSLELSDRAISRIVNPVEANYTTAATYALAILEALKAGVAPRTVESVKI
eukprot:146826-Alexandrium_andersonii.AAC.1